MSFRRITVLGLGVVLCIQATVAAAQPKTNRVDPQPVSPGGFAKATVAPACPVFSWTRSQWAIAYELVVFEVDASGQLASMPALQANLPGGAAAWTPSVAKCLSPGGRFVWFIRETGPGGPVGNWSDGMAFTVLDEPASADAVPVDGSGTAQADRASASATDATRDTSSGKSGTTVTAVQTAAFSTAAITDAGLSATADHGRSTPPPTNQEILNRLNDVLAILNKPEPTFSFQLCTEPAFQGELEAGSQITLDGTIEGRVGAEGYGNGAMVRLKGAPAEKFEGKLKGGWDILKLGMCWDIGATVRNRQAAASLPAGTAPAKMATASGDVAAPDLADTIAGLDTAKIQEKLQALAAKLQFNPAASIDALEGLGEASLERGPFAALGEQGIFKRLVQDLPLPANIRTLLQDPGSVLNGFKEIRDQGLCNVDLPPALSGPIGEICGLIANERFSKLLDRVDSAVSLVKNTVDGIVDRLPTGDDCKFFCRE